ncbi:MAG TPA: Hsp70 family protein, partial [Pseudonocardia sp.]|nr:Hsp70 family protein [Pseudonocardia sp.]
SRTLRSAGITPSELGAVLLVGGSSRIPLIAKMVSAELGRPIVVDAHPKYAVALGAATLAAHATTGQVRTEFVDHAGGASTASTASSADAAPPPTRPPAPPPPLREVPVQEPARLAHRLPPPPRQAPPNQPAPNQGPPRQGPPPGVEHRPPAPAHAYSPGPPDAPPAWAYPPGATQNRVPAHSDTIPPGRMAPARPTPTPSTRPPYAPPPVPPGPGAGASPWQEPPSTERHDDAAPPPPARARRRGVLVGALVVIVLALVAAAYLLVLRPAASAGTTQLNLTTSQVRIGDSYFATASGFLPGEKVTFSWTGPTNGVMEADPTDTNGRTTHGPIIERDPPGRYVIIATGMTTGRRATADIEVLPEDGN